LTATAALSRLGAEELRERARSLLPRLRERVEVTEERRHIPPETIEDFRDLGLLRILQPARFGGHELGYDVINDIAIDLAGACASSAWCFVILNTGSMLAGFPDEAQHDVWDAKPDAITCGVFAPTPHVAQQDGGYVVHGRWPFASGSDHSDWAMLAGLNLAGGIPELRFFLFPRSDYRIEDDWYVSGLRGTGSKTIVIDEPTFVPAHRSIDMGTQREGKTPGSQVNTSWLYRIPLAATFPAGVAVIGVGIARAAYAAWVEENRTKMNYGVIKVADSVAMQMRCADAAARIDAADLLLRNDVDSAQARIANGEELTLLDRARAQRNAAFATRLCVEAVDNLFEASGGSGLHDGHPVQRAWRDMHAVAAHISLRWDGNAEHYGRITWGRTPGNPFFF